MTTKKAKAKATEKTTDPISYIPTHDDEALSWMGHPMVWGLLRRAGNGNPPFRKVRERMGHPPFRLSDGSDCPSAHLEKVRYGMRTVVRIWNVELFART
jgi:hypothetical protein